MFELAKATALVHKVRGEPFGRWPTAQEALDFASLGGSRCAGHGDRLGRIEQGAAGDLVLIDRRAVALTPLLHPARQLVYGSVGRDVRTVVVDGRVVVDEGRVLGVDASGILERAERYAEPPAGGVSAELRRLEGIVGGVYAEAERAEIGLDAYVGSGLAPGATSARTVVGEPS
jgi:5-methylthioadenosine/S-adenosylhomocysteine deaminase